MTGGILRLHGEPIPIPLHGRREKKTKISSTDAAIHNCETQPAGPQREWVKELMIEQGIRALPRDTNALGRALDSRISGNHLDCFQSRHC